MKITVPILFIRLEPETIPMKNIESPFGEAIYAYTRKQAIADGCQVEITKNAQAAGIRFPVFITRTAFDAYVTVPPNAEGQDEAGRLWDIVWMLRFAIRRASAGQSRLPFALYVRNDNREPPSGTRPSPMRRKHGCASGSMSLAGNGRVPGIGPPVASYAKKGCV